MNFEIQMTGVPSAVFHDQDFHFFFCVKTKNVRKTCFYPFFEVLPFQVFFSYFFFIKSSISNRLEITQPQSSLSIKVYII